MNGAILGMTRAQVERRYDEIVDFADISAFIDQPIKYYSSGMLVRLAFSIATAVEPEILLVDEVLSVGDLAFQKKARKRMMEMMNQARLRLRQFDARPSADTLRRVLSTWCSFRHHCGR